MRKVTLLCVCLLLAISCQAKIITVDDDGPADFNNIQAAIDDSNDGDTIIVGDGTYTGYGNRDIDFLGKAITVRSESGPDNCIIDCDGTLENKHRGFYFHSGEDNNSVVRGFTITNGYADRGGAIYCISSSPTLTNCIFGNNTAQYWGQFISSTGLEDPEPMANDGNGVHIMIPLPLPGWRGQGGGVYCRTSNPTLTNCTFSGNSAVLYGGVIFNSGSDATLSNSILWGNTATDGNEIYLEYYIDVFLGVEYPSTINVDYSNVEDGAAGVYVDTNCTLNWSQGNISDDPCFADPHNGDYHLKSQAGRWDTASQSWMQVVLRQPEIWICWLKDLEKRRSSITDVAQAERLLEQGRQAVNNEDVESLKAAVRQLICLLPPEPQEEVHGYGGTTIKDISQW